MSKRRRLKDRGFVVGRNTDDKGGTRSGGDYSVRPRSLFSSEKGAI